MEKNLITFILILSLTGCATVRRHPVITGVVIGVAAASIGATVAIMNQRGHCPGEYSTGDPPCPPPIPGQVRH